MATLKSDLKKMNTQLKMLCERMDNLVALIQSEEFLDEIPSPVESKKQEKSIMRISEETRSVLEMISSNADGINIHLLREKTGFTDKKISNIVQRASKKGFIKRVGRGIYKAS